MPILYRLLTLEERPAVEAQSLKAQVLSLVGISKEAILLRLRSASHSYWTRFPAMAFPLSL
jgi:hypothetical protein